ncbi:MAG: hypothetical protein JW959_00935, partial [Pirellulales bacterium]|nr:hypothetical protein [Pirellulales bacterium]
MVRAFRYYGKKRGHWRTGTPAWGLGFEAALSALFFVAGCVVLVSIISGEVLPRWRVNHEFVEAACKVRNKEVEEVRDNGGPEYRPKLHIEYEKIRSSSGHDVKKTTYDNRRDAEAVLDLYEIYAPEKNNLYPCWYDPADPYEVVLTRQYPRWLWPAFAVPISFIVIGAGGLIHTMIGWGKSAERRSVRSRNGVEGNLLGLRGQGDRRCPFVPDGADITNSPGTRLKYRLPIGASAAWTLFGTLAFCVFWNGLVAVFLGVVVHGHLSAKPDWFGTFFIIPFVLIGIGAIVFFLRQLLIATGIGPTRL